MNNTFSLTRMWKYLQLFLAINRKNFLARSGALFALLVCFLGIVPWMFQSYRFASPFDTMWTYVRFVFTLVFVIFSALNGGLFYRALGRKGSRITTLTLPASNLEKFCSWFLVYIVGFTALFFVEFFVADFLRVAIAQLYAVPGATVEMLPPSLVFITPYDLSSVSPFAASTLTFVSILTAQSFYVLCSSIWPRNGVLGGIAFLMIFSFVINIIAISSFFLFLNGKPEFRSWIYFLSDGISSTLFTILTAISIIQATGFYLLSYLRFKEMETINRW